MVATLWLLTITLITASECVYAAPSLLDYRHSGDNAPLGLQDEYFLGEDRPKRLTLSVNDSIQKLRRMIELNHARERARERSEQIEKNQAYFRSVGKRGNARQLSLEREYYEPYPHHLDLSTLIKTLSDTNYQQYHIPAETASPENINSGTPFRNMHMNIDDDAQNDRFIDLNDERAWLQEKQQRHFNQIPNQQQLNEQNKNFLRQWDNKQFNDRTQVPLPQAQQQQQQQENQQQQEQKQQRQPDNLHQPIKSFDNDERFMLQTFDTK